MVTKWQMFFSRMLFAFVNIGVGTSYLLQRPPVDPPPRKFLTDLSVPFGIYGSLFIIFGLLIVLGTVADRPQWLVWTFQPVAVLWMLFSMAYLVPVLTDPWHVLWSGFVLYFFVGAIHQAATLIEVHRV